MILFLLSLLRPNHNPHMFEIEEANPNGEIRSGSDNSNERAPGQWKSTLAHAIASALRIPLLDKDDVKDCTTPLQLTSPASLLNDLSYDAIWQIASTQLRLGLSVLLDSPLSRRSHLDRLLRLATSTSARLLIIECRPADHAEWRRRLESRGGGGHKPATWRDLEKLLEEYGGCTEYDVGDVPEMVVDTTAPVPLDEMCFVALEFIFSHAAATPTSNQI